MIVTFPHLSHAWVALKTLFDKNGIECIVPPRSTQRTMTLGSRYSPEWICIPYKILLGNLIEGLEMGADTVLDVGGAGLCRLGWYARLHEEALRGQGFDFRMAVFDWQDGGIVSMARFVRELIGDVKPWREIVGDIKFGIQQLMLLDALERRVHQLRPREAEASAVSHIWKTAPDRVTAAHSPKALRRVRDELNAELDQVALKPDANPLRVAFLGEYFLVVDAYCNMDIEEEMGRRGVEVVRSHYLTEWAKAWLFLDAVGLSHGKKIKQAAAPYLKRDVSGDGVHSLGETIIHQQEGLDGVVHIMPFTCMPEIIAVNIFPKVTKDFRIPVLSIVRDEQTAKAGMLTRIEAFIDLMERSRMRAAASPRS